MMLERTRVAAFFLLICVSPVMAQSSSSAETAIKDALVTWTAHFNKGDTSRICELFSMELRYDYRGQPERGFQDICNLLQRSLNDPTRKYSYSLEIKEILVSGDLAVVRLI
jgi:ketosteroid isomerase-like protein